MEGLIVRIFENIFKAMQILIFCGLIAGVLGSLQKSAFQAKKVGLVSLLNVNQQLVGNIK